MPLDFIPLTDYQTALYYQMRARFGDASFTRAEAAEATGKSKSAMRDAMDAFFEAGLVHKVRYAVYSFRAPARQYAKPDRTVQTAARRNPGPKAEAKPVQPLPHVVHPGLKHHGHVVRAEEKRAERNNALAALKTDIAEPSEQRRRAGR